MHNNNGNTTTNKNQVLDAGINLFAKINPSTCLMEERSSFGVINKLLRKLTEKDHLYTQFGQQVNNIGKNGS